MDDIETKAKQLYDNYVKNHPKRTVIDFPAWKSINEFAKEYWLQKAKR